MKKKLLVTAGGGFIGSNFLNKSNIINKFHVVALYRNSVPKKVEGVDYLKVDLTDFKDCQNIIKDFDLIFHCAGVSMTSAALKQNPYKGLLDNLKIHTNIIEAIKNKPPKKFIWLSSVTGYPESVTDLKEEEYFSRKVSKRYEIVGGLYRLMEVIISKILKNNCHLITLRPTGVYGEGSDFSPNSSLILAKIIHDIDLKILPKKIFAQKEEKRNWLYVGDLVNALDTVIEKIDLSINLNIGADQSVSMFDLYSKIIDLYGLEDNYILDTTNQFPDPPLARNIDCNLSVEYLGKYNSTSFEQGLINTIEWFKNARK